MRIFPKRSLHCNRLRSVEFRDQYEYQREMAFVYCPKLRSFCFVYAYGSAADDKVDKDGLKLQARRGYFAPQPANNKK